MGKTFHGKSHIFPNIIVILVLALTSLHLVSFRGLEFILLFIVASGAVFLTQSKNTLNVGQIKLNQKKLSDS